MDSHGDAEANIKSVGDGHITHPPLFRGQGENGDGHCEGDGGMGRRPTPEDPATEEAEPFTA